MNHEDSIEACHDNAKLTYVVQMSYLTEAMVSNHCQKYLKCKVQLILPP